MRVMYILHNLSIILAASILCPANRRRWPNVGLLLSHRLRRWPNSKQTYNVGRPIVNKCWANVNTPTPFSPNYLKSTNGLNMPNILRANPPHPSFSKSRKRPWSNACSVQMKMRSSHDYLAQILWRHGGWDRLGYVSDLSLPSFR